MEKGTFNGLEIRSLSTVVEETRQFIDDRRSGKENSLKVGSSKVNKAFMNGIDWNRIITIAGMSGSGKSTILRQWVMDMIDLNKDQDFDVLSFQFEMLGLDEVAKDISSKANIPIKELYSADGVLDDTRAEIVDKELDKLKEKPIFIVDNIGTVNEIKDTILYYVTQKKLIEKKRSLVVTLDHSLLVKAKDGDDEKVTLDKLMHTVVALKKFLSSKGLKVIFILLSQLNRNIESIDRVVNNKLHYPNKTDMFGASSVYYSSDYVIIIHRPCLIDGIGNWYGPARKKFPQGLPVFNPENTDQPMIYLHVIKERFGSNKIIAMVDELKYSRVSEYKQI